MTADNGTPIVEMRDVHKSFGPQHVLRGIDLRLPKGQTTVIIGASGVGKSVILKHIVGLLKPDKGTVHFVGQRIDNLSERALSKLRTRFGFLFQLGALFDSLTAAENVAFPLIESGRYTRQQAQAVVLEKLRMVGLEDFGRKRPAELSGGQRKRVALARAIALDPELVLYDEPTTGLDPPRGDVINELIVKLKRELHQTGIVVTHDMASALKVADRIIMLHEGRFIFGGTPDEIRKCEDPRVREFIEGRAQPEDLASLYGKSA